MRVVCTEPHSRRDRGGFVLCVYVFVYIGSLAYSNLAFTEAFSCSKSTTSRSLRCAKDTASMAAKRGMCIVSWSCR